MSKQNQMLFIIGFKEGYSKGRVDLISDLLVEHKGRLEIPNNNDLFKNKYDLEVINGVVSKIYEDPSNVYLSPYVVIEIAIDKLQGRPTEKKLEMYRKAVTVKMPSKEK